MAFRRRTLNVWTTGRVCVQMGYDEKVESGQQFIGEEDILALEPADGS